MVIVAINDKNKVVREAKLPSSKRALDDFFSTFDEPVQAVVECTSFWYWLSDWCQDNDIQLTLAHSKMPGPSVTPRSKPIRSMRRPWLNCYEPTSYQKPAKRSLTGGNSAS
ncbi:MAG TPA: hypothetical protein VK112_03670 [Fodinibius sp.]|nr:hypothetical protein [Fodinibius sp.]